MKEPYDEEDPWEKSKREDSKFYKTCLLSLLLFATFISLILVDFKGCSSTKEETRDCVVNKIMEPIYTHGLEIPIRRYAYQGSGLINAIFVSGERIITNSCAIVFDNEKDN